MVFDLQLWLVVCPYQMPEKLRFAHYLCFVQDVKERFKHPVRVLRLQRYNGAKVGFTILFDFKVRNMG